MAFAAIKNKNNNTKQKRKPKPFVFEENFSGKVVRPCGKNIEKLNYVKRVERH